MLGAERRRGRREDFLRIIFGVLCFCFAMVDVLGWILFYGMQFDVQDCLQRSSKDGCVKAAANGDFHRAPVILDGFPQFSGINEFRHVRSHHKFRHQFSELFADLKVL